MLIFQGVEVIEIWLFHSWHWGDRFFKRQPHDSMISTKLISKHEQPTNFSTLDLLA